MSQSAAQASSQDINILIVIDTEYVKKNNPQQNNPDPNKPVGIDHNSQYMICYDPRGGIKNQATADLQFSALPGDNVSFMGQSIYGNSDDAVIIYGITYWSGDHVFNQFDANTVVRSGAVVPNPDAPSRNGLPALQQSISFATFDTRVRQKGTQNFYVNFALYTCTDGSNQKLYGYFYWDPSIVVK